MPLWKIYAKNTWNWGKDRMLTKGMFIEMSTQSTTPPLNSSTNAETIARAFNVKYSTNFDKSKMTRSYLECEKIG